MSTNAKIEHCTSCGSKDIVVAGNKFLCRPCNIVYEVTDTGTKVLETNPLSEIEQRLANAERALEVLKKAGQGGQEPAPEPEPEPEPADEPDENETEKDGFITW